MLLQCIKHALSLHKTAKIGMKKRLINSRVKHEDFRFQACTRYWTDRTFLRQS